MAMQCFAKIGKFISLANGFSRSSSEAELNGRFGWLNGMLGVSSGHNVILNNHDIARVFRANSNKASGHDIVRVFTKRAVSLLLKDSVFIQGVVSFSPQRRHRINLHCPPRRNVAGHKRDSSEQQRHDQVSQRVYRAHLIKQTVDDSRRDERYDQAGA
jgi:hypothetical protein